MAPNPLRTILSGALLCGACGAFGAACTTEPDSSGEEESKFSVGQLSTELSILPAIESSRGAPAVCVGLIGFGANERRTAADRVAALVTDAARKWNALLRGNPLWLVQGDVSPVYAFQESECPRTGPGFNVNVWATAERFKADYCVPSGYPCVPAVIAAYRSLYLGPWNRDRPMDPFHPHVALHEYGHLLGLGDTYKVAGGTDWRGEQPPSVMNAGSMTLTEDDKLGLWVTLKELKTGVRSCDGFGENVPMTQNPWGILMCNPSARPTNTHDRPTPAVASTLLPNEGRWAFEGHEATVTGMLVTAVTRTATGFTMTAGGLENGRPSGSAGPYHCSPAGVCAAQSDSRYRLLVTSNTTMQMINPSSPAGIRLGFVSP